MEKQYREIELEAGEDLTSAMKLLNEYKAKNELVFINFNGCELYSDIDDLDSAYVKLTGKTKEQVDEEQSIRHEKYEEEKRKHEESIPELTKEWIEKGREILDEQYHELWTKCVPIRLSDLYRGMELGMCLDIVDKLNKNCSLYEAKSIINNQGHSGMSYSLVSSMVKAFCKRGNEFVNYIN